MCKEPFYNLYIYKGLHCKMTRIFPILTSSLPVILFLMSPVRGLISFSLNPRKHQGQRLSALLCAGSKRSQCPLGQGRVKHRHKQSASIQAAAVAPLFTVYSSHRCHMATCMGWPYVSGPVACSHIDLTPWPL